MTGTIQSKTLRSGKTYLYVYLNYKDLGTGKWKHKTVPTGLEEKGNKRKAQAMIASIIEKYFYLEDAPINLTTLSPEVTLLEYLDIWLAQKKIDIETATYESYQYRSQGIIRFFQKYHPAIKLRDVTASILNQFFTYQLQYGKINQGRPEITLHKLRHTCASLLINEGWDPKKLQYWLGHSDISTTLNIYAHFNKSRMNEAPDDLDKLTQGIKFLF